MPYKSISSDSNSLPLGLSLDSIFNHCEELPFTSISGKHPKQIGRGAAWMTDNGCTCKYKYGGKFHPPNPTPDWLHIVGVHVAQLIGLSDFEFSASNANYYNDGTETLWWHSDDEHLFSNIDGNVTIVSLSIGATRAFEFKKKFASAKQDFKTVDLESGDILVMTGAMQSHYMHNIPQSNTLYKRYNITFRYLTSHHPSCLRHSIAAKKFTGIFRPQHCEDVETQD